VDGYLVSGVQEYVVGSLPWAVRALVALGGVSGNKEKGENYVARVASEGKLARDQARVLLVLLKRREGQPLKAAEILQGLIADFPRNYILALELGAMFQDAGKPEQALQVFRSLQRRVKEKAPGHERMPQESRKALQRKIEKLEAQLAKPATQAASLSQ
jgi:predicted Zn-dependent protease